MEKKTETSPAIPTITSHDIQANNDLLAQGYHFSVITEYRYAGMQNFNDQAVYDKIICYFKTREEAEAFTPKGIDPWCGDEARVEEVTHHSTYEEIRAEAEAYANAKREARIKKETAKAESLGMTREAYKAMKYEEAKRKRYAKELAELKERVAYLEAYLRG